MTKVIPLEKLMLRRGGAVDPSKFTEEEFDLYSIPAFDRGKSELTLGRDIGSSKQLLEANDVLLSKIVPHIRRAWVVGPPRGKRIIGSGEWIVFRSKTIEPRYLANVLVGDSFHKKFMQTVSGVGGSLLRARPAQVAQIQIPFPPLPEQKRIAAILDAADAIRTKRRESLAQLDVLLQSTFLDMFGDPVTNPKGWPVVSLNRVGKFISGGTPSKARDDFWNGSIPWVSPKDMKVTRIVDSQDHISELAFSESSLKLLSPGHLLIVVRGMILAHSFPIATNLVPVAINQDMKGILPSNSANTFFLLECIRHLKRQILCEVSTAGHGTKRFDAEAMKKILVPLPPLDLQRRFATIVEAVEKQKDRLRAHLAELDTLFASLQHRAFNGEL